MQLFGRLRNGASEAILWCRHRPGPFVSMLARAAGLALGYVTRKAAHVRFALPTSAKIKDRGRPVGNAVAEKNTFAAFLNAAPDFAN
jgi:hypothetical protein